MWGHDRSFFPFSFFPGRRKRGASVLVGRLDQTFLLKHVFSKFINSDCACAGRVCMHRLLLEHPECILCSPHSVLLCLFFIIPSKKQRLTPSTIMCFLWLHLCTVSGDFKLERWHSPTHFINSKLC